MKKKTFFTIGIAFFAIGILYINANYEIAYYPEDATRVALESRSIGEDGKVHIKVAQQPKEGLRIGNFVISKK